LVHLGCVGVLACGARTQLSEIEEPPSDAGTVFPSAVPTSTREPKCGAPAPPASAPCGPMHFSLQTAESCALSIQKPMDATGLVPFSCPATLAWGNSSCPNTTETCFEVFAMTRFGKGHVAAWCDSTKTTELIERSKVLPYLGQQREPRVARLGNGYCG